MDNVLLVGNFNKSKLKLTLFLSIFWFILGAFIAVVGTFYVFYLSLANTFLFFITIGFGLIFIVIGVVGIISGIHIYRQKLTLTDTNIVGSSAEGKTYTLPYNRITNVTKEDGSQSLNIGIGTTSPVKFAWLENYIEVYNFLIEKMSNDNEQIIKYKELLDQGIISQEEFDAKKKELLGL